MRSKEQDTELCETVPAFSTGLFVWINGLRRLGGDKILREDKTGSGIGELCDHQSIGNSNPGAFSVSWYGAGESYQKEVGVRKDSEHLAFPYKGYIDLRASVQSGEKARAA